MQSSYLPLLVNVAANCLFILPVALVRYKVLSKKKGQILSIDCKDQNIGVGPEEEHADELSHGSDLPNDYVSKIPFWDIKAVELLLAFIASEPKLSAVDGLLINGGYVRDLLLRRTPDDLDISICLIGCDDDITVEWILNNLCHFALSHQPLFGFDKVQVASIIGDVTKNKMLDTAKAVLYSSRNGNKHRLEIDLMPTIGEEVYEEANRIPTRNQRGTPEEDALRRDLTIGAMFIQVKCKDLDFLKKTNQKVDCRHLLEWKLLDYYGGINDLRYRSLRAPCPVSQAGPSLNKQVTQWIRILQDDPIRIIRVLRFAAKLDFSIHEDFWRALPQAIGRLKAKVAGSRKVTELLKLAKYGTRKLLVLMNLAFDTNKSLAPALFGGKDGSGEAQFFPPIVSFQSERFKRILKDCEYVETSEDRLLGVFLSVAILCSTFESKSDNRLVEKIRHFNTACDGLCCSNEMRSSGIFILESIQSFQLLSRESSSTLPCSLNVNADLYKCFASEKLIATEQPDSADAQFLLNLRVWKVLNLSRELASSIKSDDTESVDHFFGIKVAKLYSYEIVFRCVPNDLSVKVRRSFENLTLNRRFEVTGKHVSALTRIPPHMRGVVLESFQVFCKLVKRKIPENQGLADIFPSVIDRLTRELYEGDSLVLKGKYKPKKATKSRKKVKKKAK
mmetsp:Transcript_14551/g.16981  ORF Transcript_14551/g.16981 Transcript_14551/m.16981 type:complete len:675 (+) Transcript_14551:128-2152(+)